MHKAVLAAAFVFGSFSSLACASDDTGGSAGDESTGGDGDGDGDTDTDGDEDGDTDTDGDGGCPAEVVQMCDELTAEAVEECRADGGCDAEMGCSAIICDHQCGWFTLGVRADCYEMECPAGSPPLVDEECMDGCFSDQNTCLYTAYDEQGDACASQPCVAAFEQCEAGCVPEG